MSEIKPKKIIVGFCQASHQWRFWDLLNDKFTETFENGLELLKSERIPNEDGLTLIRGIPAFSFSKERIDFRVKEFHSLGTPILSLHDIPETADQILLLPKGFVFTGLGIEIPPDFIEPPEGETVFDEEL